MGRKLSSGLSAATPFSSIRTGLQCGLVLAVALLAVASYSSIAAAAPAATTTTTTVPQTDAAGTVWLCRPGLASDPCAGDTSETTVTASGQRTVSTESANGNPQFNCFYVYPTASNETTVNSDLTVQSAETSIAMDQAQRFSSVCNVWAPMYNQVTVSGLSQANSTDPGAYTVAYDSVLSAFNDFIANYDNGLPIVFIGHSQGSVMLIKLLQAQVDTNPALRKLLVTAIIAGGNVTVPTGKTVGATFQNLPLCTATNQSGCIIAYSSFPSEPPADANFGIPGQGISLNTGQTATTGVQVACVNPAAIGGGTANLETYWPVSTPLPIPSMAPPAPAITTPWIYYPDQYTGTCESAGGATWLQVTALDASGDTRPVVNEIAGPTWGYHFQDINLALGDLVNDVGNAEEGYQVRQPPATAALIPSNGATVSGPSAPLDASASSVGLAVASVTFEVSGGALSDQVVATATPTIYGWLAQWNTTAVPNGTYTLQSVATDNLGETTSSSPITVTVNNSAPTTSILVPATGTTQSGAAAVLDAGASANVTSVSFEVSGGALSDHVVATATPTIYGWLAQWNTTTIPNGTYTLQSVASYAGGVSGASAPITLTVNNPPPTTSVLIPASTATQSGTAATLDASASANVTSVSFEVSGGALSDHVVATATPTIYGWLAQWNTTTIPNGTYTLQSVASYAGNVSGTSQGISITIAD